MSIQPRFYAPDVRADAALVTLPDDEATHLTRVLRLHAGDPVRVFDGRGHEFDAVVESAGKSGVALRLLSPRPAAPEPRVAVTLAQAVLKGDKMDDVIRDAVMLGVAVVQPVITDRTEISLASLERGRRVDRWQRVAVSAAKQCGRAVVPAVVAPIAFATLIEHVLRREVSAPALMLVEPDAAAEAMSLSELAEPKPACTLVIGPEGGWSAGEIEAGTICQRVTLGGRTIRADAMPLVAMAALFAAWKEF